MQLPGDQAASSGDEASSLRSGASSDSDATPSIHDDASLLSDEALSADRLVALARDPGTWTGEDVIERARRYLRDGRVRKLETRGGFLAARVDGRRKTPYKVTVDARGAEPKFACSCPYDGDPLCKHGTVALFAHLRQIEGEAAPEMPARAERRHSARKESWNIRNVGPDRYLSTFDVQGDAGHRYTVEVRDPGGLTNRCTCPDHRTSLLGTCKHIEAVLETLRRRAPVKMERLACGPPPFGQLLVRWDGPPRVALRLPRKPSDELLRLHEQHFDAKGLLILGGGDGAEDSDQIGLQGQVYEGTGRGYLRDVLPAVLQQAQSIDGLRVYDDVHELLEAESEADRRAETTRQIAASLRQGALEGQADLGLRARLYPYQVEGVAFLASRGRALMADDMGLGKTLQALAAFAFLRKQGHARRALVVCPASLKHQWKDEAERFTDFSVEVVAGAPAARKAQYRRRADLTVINYELVLRDRKVLGREVASDLLILDEAQRIRNWRTQTAAAVKELCTDHAFVLTGTPLENRLEDLYSIMQVVDSEVLGPLWNFRHRYLVEDPESGQVIGYRNLDQLRRRLEPVLLRRTRAEVLEDLPNLVVNRFRFDLTPEQREIHDDAEYEITILAAIGRKRRLTPEEEKRLLLLLNIARIACNAAVLLDKEWWGERHLQEMLLDEALRWPKLRELRRLLLELCVDESKKVVVFSEWRRMQLLAEAIAKELELGPVSLHGGVPAAHRGALIARFRDDPACRVFLSTDAGSVGLNLQGAEAVAVLDLPWNPAVLAQRIARVHRHGQKRSVHALQFISRDCLEARIEILLEGKRSLFDAALGASDLTEMPRPSTSQQIIRATMQAYGVEDDGRASEDDRQRRRERQAGSAAPDEGGAETANGGALDGGHDAPLKTGEASELGDDQEAGQAMACHEGDGSPQPETPAFAPGARRRRFADRQAEAAEVLAAAGLGGSSLVSIHSAVRAEILAALEELNGAAGNGESIPAEASHDWIVEQIHRRLVPERVSLEEASLLGQARDLAAAFGASVSVPPGLAGPLLERLQSLRHSLRAS